ncbi:hypothetical protein DDB_G0284717 [Dictyostelium discoideum AX4]|uniref:Uncharacterized protein n=1 Tax=Dictyostelium discoideum TaxID=44689 RepID=Q54PE5_DICDI|nr:hypothetical protein DDB_G0284717 [Dictyostelium discoideum AX4]EAL65128.1 hypothetical protein DDB_G0284717 [Dictyostelium discoideum AX4]|eukprot:XP_638430.1 hypothetical protein DDB_G0284717 [Dictyostelium discoideum AX4]
MIHDEDELIRKELKSFENKVDNYVEDGFCLACGQFTSHYFRHCNNIHQKFHVYKVIIDLCKPYPREWNKINGE